MNQVSKLAAVFLFLCGLGFALGGWLIYLGLRPPGEAMPAPPVVPMALPGEPSWEPNTFAMQRSLLVPIHAAPITVGTFFWKGDVMHFEGDVEATAKSIRKQYSFMTPLTRFSISDGVTSWTARFETTDAAKVEYVCKWDDSAKAVVEALLRRLDEEKAKP